MLKADSNHLTPANVLYKPSAMGLRIPWHKTADDQYKTHTPLPASAHVVMFLLVSGHSSWRGFLRLEVAITILFFFLPHPRASFFHSEDIGVFDMFSSFEESVSLSLCLPLSTVSLSLSLSLSISLSLSLRLPLSLSLSLSLVLSKASSQDSSSTAICAPRLHGLPLNA